MRTIELQYILIETKMQNVIGHHTKKHGILSIDQMQWNSTKGVLPNMNIIFFHNMHWFILTDENKCRFSVTNDMILD